jgi:predicted dehydrogenase
MKVLGTILSALSSVFSPHLYRLHAPDIRLLYSKLGPRLKVVALIDPNIERASSVLTKKCETFVRSAYEHTRIFKTLEDFVQNMLPRDRPRAVIVGSPPMFRGTTTPGRDIELQILRHFPGVALFIEKPIATGPEDEIAEAFKVCQAIVDSGAVCSVG